MPQPAISMNSLVATLVTGMLAVSGCMRANEAIAETAMEQANGDRIDIEQTGDTIDIKTERGTTAMVATRQGGSVALPAGFPDDIFLPAQRTVSSAMDISGVKAVNVATATPLAQVSADVESTMQARGWTREIAMQTSADSATLIYSKDARQAVYQLLRSEDGGTQLAVRTGSEG